jgi:hypothetical protein
VTPETGTKLGPLTAEVVIGRGSIIAAAGYAIQGRPDKNPFAITYIGSIHELLVPDVRTGHAHRFGIDMSPLGDISGPLVADARAGGSVTGVAWDENTDRLVWTLVTADGSFLQVTDRAGKAIGSKARIQAPFKLRKVPVIGDISFDKVRNEIWGIDRQNNLAFTFGTTGRLTSLSNDSQLGTPTPNGVFGGGVSVAQSDTSTVILDLVAGSAPLGATLLERMAYVRTGDAVSVTGTARFKLDLRRILQASEIGGVAFMKQGQEENAFVVGIDTLTIYKLKVDMAGVEFRRGDTNNDGMLNLSDAIFILFNILKVPDVAVIRCDDAADVNEDQKVNISDAVYLFKFLFASGPEPLPPFQRCGLDFDATLTCQSADCK